MLLLGFAIVVVSARLTVYSASNIAVALGVPPILIGAKIVATGTSLPELALYLTAVKRGRVQLALGDLPFLLITTVIFWRFIMRGGVSKTGGAVLILTHILFQALVMKV